jgi:hypothetical protein
VCFIFSACCTIQKSGGDATNLEDVFKLIDQLSPNEKHQVRQYLEQQPDVLRRDIDDLLISALPVTLQSGTLDADQLLQAVQGMWEGLDEAEIEAIVQAMNEE